MFGKRSFSYVLVVLFLIVSLTNIYAQRIPMSVSASLDSSQALIGDQIKLTLKVQYLKDYQLSYPKFADSLGKLLVLFKSKLDTTQDAKSITLTQKITLTSFDSGYYEVPPIEFTYGLPNDTLKQSEFTNILYVKFFSVDIDTSKPIKDIKPPLELPFSIWDYLWYIIGFLLFILLGLAIFYWIYKRKPKIHEIEKFDPKIPAHVQALNDLEKLESEKLWQSGRVKEYHSRLTDILRLYLERRFNMPALELTTGEIMQTIQTMLSGADILRNLKLILETADLVKFAKSIPLPDENTKVMELTRNIIESTIPIEQESENGGNANG